MSTDFVQDEAAEKIAKEHQMSYYKTSAFTGDNIEQMIKYTIQQVYDTKLKSEIEELKKSNQPVA